MTDILPRIGRTGLAELVVTIVEERILQGEWPPGYRLPSEPEFGQQLGVSRSVVRDAMKTLAARGLVDVRQGSGTVVADATPRAYTSAIYYLLSRSDLTLREVLEARELIETQLVGLAARRRSDSDCTALETHIAHYESAVEASDWHGAHASHVAFHLAILTAINSPAFEILLLPIQELILTAPLPPILGERDLWEVPLHKSIAKAICDGNVEQAQKYMTAHFEFVQDARYGDSLDLRLRDAALTNPADELTRRWPPVRPM